MTNKSRAVDRALESYLASWNSDLPGTIGERQIAAMTAALSAAGLFQGRPRQMHCKRGHDLSIHRHPDPRKGCMVCRRARQKTYRTNAKPVFDATDIGLAE